MIRVKYDVAQALAQQITINQQVLMAAHTLHVLHDCLCHDIGMTAWVSSQRISDLKVQTEQRRMRRSLAAISGTDDGQDREHEAAEEHALAKIQQASPRAETLEARCKHVVL